MEIIMIIIILGSLLGIFYTIKFLKARPLLSRKFWFIVIPLIPILSPIFVLITIRQGYYSWYYRNKPAPLPHYLRKWQYKDTIIFNGKTMSLAEYNKLYNKNVKLEDVYGKKYVASLTEDDFVPQNRNNEKAID